MQRTVKVFVIPPGRAPGGPSEPAREMVIEAPALDALRDVTRDRLAGDGYRVRCLSFAPGGLVACVEEDR